MIQFGQNTGWPGEAREIKIKINIYPQINKITSYTLY